MLSFDQEIHIGGYHGTDLSSAERIATEGFQETNGDVFFAPLDNLSFAQSHGQRRAEDLGDAEYGVLQAMFLGKQLELGMGGDQIKIPACEVNRITIVALRAYSLKQARLILTKNRAELSGHAGLDSL